MVVYMEFVETVGENKFRIKGEKDKNKYLYAACNYFGILDYVEGDFIYITASTISNLNIEKLKTLEKGSSISLFVFSIGLQMLILLDYKLSIKYFDVGDFVCVNNEYYLFVNYNKLFNLLSKDSFDNKKNYLDYKFGKIENINKSNNFLSPELKRGDSIVYYTNMFYSFGLIIQYIFGFNIKDIYYTKMYFMITRCLDENPFNREFLYI